MATTLRIILDLPCDSIEHAVEQALSLDRSSEPIEISIDGRVVIDGRQLRRKMAEATSN